MNERVAAPVSETEINGRADPLRWLRRTHYHQKLALILLKKEVVLTVRFASELKPPDEKQTKTYLQIIIVI
jgi:hypothetical protein